MLIINHNYVFAAKKCGHCYYLENDEIDVMTNWINDMLALQMDVDLRLLTVNENERMFLQIRPWFHVLNMLDM